MMACLVVLHTIGGHFPFEGVPFGQVTDLFGFSRNHYDRMAHFTAGFYAYPLAEILLRKHLVLSRLVLVMFPICFILTVAGIYGNDRVALCGFRRSRRRGP
jgi:putative membrane protein